MKNVALFFLTIFLANAALAFTLEEAQGVAEQCKNPRNIDFVSSSQIMRINGFKGESDYLSSSELGRIRGDFVVFAITENAAVIGHHYCSTDNRISIIDMKGKLRPVRAGFCLESLKNYQIRYQQCLEVNSLLEEAAKPKSHDPSVIQIPNMTLKDLGGWQANVLSKGKMVGSVYCPSRGLVGTIVIDNNAYRLKEQDCDILYSADADGKTLMLSVDLKSRSVNKISY